jgi:hypothetical protein
VHYLRGAARALGFRLVARSVSRAVSREADVGKRKTFQPGQSVEFRRARSREWEPGVYLRKSTLMSDDVMHDVLVCGVTFTVPTRRIRAKESK